jgi:transketolase
MAWRVALEHRDGPVTLVFTRQAVPTLDRSVMAPADGLRRGAYVLDDGDADPSMILIASGSDLHLIVQAAQRLRESGLTVRCVSMPSWELFEAQPQEYRDSVLPPGIRARLAVEAGATQGWERYVGDRGDVLGIDHFGASAPGDLNLEKFGFTVDEVCRRAKAVLSSAAASARR